MLPGTPSNGRVLPEDDPTGCREANIPVGVGEAMQVAVGTFALFKAKADRRVLPKVHEDVVDGVHNQRSRARHALTELVDGVGHIGASAGTHVHQAADPLLAGLHEFGVRNFSGGHPLEEGVGDD